jgi:hypothetical protein
MRLNRSWEIKGRFHPQISHAILHDLEVDGNNTSHLDSTAERNLAISLREVKVSDTEFGTLNMDREIDFATTTQIFDVAVAAVFRTSYLQVNRISEYARD